MLSLVSQDISYDSPFSKDKKTIGAVKDSLMEFRRWLDRHEARVVPLTLVNENGNHL